MNYDYVILLLILIITLLLSFKKEKFGWSCTFIPNEDYYKEEWILGEIGERIGDGFIKK